MAKNRSKSILVKTKRREKPEIVDEQESILRAATLHLIRKVGGLFVATGMREQADGTWIITVTMRYPTGHEGYVGDLLFNGKTFTMLTEQSVLDERVRQIEADPEGMRQWHEYRDSAPGAGEA